LHDLVQNLLDKYTYRFSESFTTLMIASYFGLEAVVTHLLEIGGINLNSKDGTYRRTALSWAAGNGFDVIVKLLIKALNLFEQHRQATV